MAEETIAFTPDQEAQGTISGNLDQQVEQPGAEPKVSYVTVDQFNALKDEITNEVSRKIQSLTDRAEGRISKQVREQVQVLREAANELASLPANVPQSVRDKVYNDAVASVKGAEISEVPPQELADFSKRIEMVGASILDAIGVNLEPDDPEYKSVITTRTPEEYLDSLTKSAKNKKLRLSGETPAELPGSPIGRMPAAAVGTSTRSQEAITAELMQLLEKPKMTPADKKRADELELEIRRFVKGK